MYAIRLIREIRVYALKCTHYTRYARIYTRTLQLAALGPVISTCLVVIHKEGCLITAELCVLQGGLSDHC